MRSPFASITAAVAVTTIVFTHASAVAAELARPNVVILLSDNLGYGDLGVYGGGVMRGTAMRRRSIARARPRKSERRWR